MVEESLEQSRKLKSPWKASHVGTARMLLEHVEDRLLPCPGYYKQCCDEHWGTRVSFPSGFLSVYPGEKARSWGALGEARPGQSSLSAGALRYRAWAQSWSSAALVFLPGESQGQWSLVGCHLWGHTGSDTTEAT